MSLFACIFAIIITFLLPIVVSGWFAFRIPKGKVVVLGAITFTVFQVFIRLPLIQQVLPTMAWYRNMISIKPVAILFFAGTAAIFEELGRYIVMKLFMKNQLSNMDGVAFGIGHGGIESIIIVGLNSVALILLSQVNLFSPVELFVSAFERLFAMSLHIGMSVMVAKSLREKKISYLFAALLSHTLIDIVAGSYSIYGLNIWIVEGLLALFAILMWIYVIWEFKKGELRI